jgi:NADH-quinone oxidoreductase subunit N
MNDFALDFRLVLPELVLLGGLSVVLLVDLWLPQARRGITHFLALLTLAFAALLTLREFHVPGEVGRAFGGMFLRDAMGDGLKTVLYLLAGAVFVYGRAYLAERRLWKGEFYVLVLAALLGMMALVSAGNLLAVYLGLELMALSSYALVAFDRDAPRSSEAAIKYFVLGALASGLMLYGMSMLYGATGSLDLAAIRQAALEGSASPELLRLGTVFLIAGIAFKFGAAPFHTWLPDVYQGSPSAITLFVGSLPKVAAFAMAFRLLEGGLKPLLEFWQPILIAIAMLSLSLGNVVALAQSNLKRMLAYSNMLHVGFILIGLSSGTAYGYASAMVYTLFYTVAAAGAFGTIVVLSARGFEAERIEDYRGLARRAPWHAFLMMLLMASLAGFPPLFGFFAKILILKAVVGAELIWVAVFALVFAVVGAFYYLRIVKLMFFDEPSEERMPAPTSDPAVRLALSVNALIQLLALFAWGPLLSFCLDTFS